MDEDEDEVPGRSVTRLTDPKALRAYAHPVRMKLIGLLRTRGPLTATQAAKLTGESSGTCSFHFRQLAKYGLVEEDDGGTGRERPWRAMTRYTSVEDDADDPASAAAGALVRSVIVDRYFERVSHWLDMRGQVAPQWRDAALFGDRFIYLTPGELTELGEKIEELVDMYAKREVRPDTRPHDARMISMLLFAFPEGEAP
jgi:predicted ArsR family transcriptional regulator